MSARRTPIRSWLRHKSWAVPVHLLLIILAFANIYPFLWMTGTSVKTALESSANIDKLVPVVKYGLSQAETDAILAPFYDQNGKLLNLADRHATEAAQEIARRVAAEKADAEANDPSLNPGQRQVLKAVREANINRRCIDNTFVPYRIDVETYAANNEYRKPDPRNPGREIPDLERAERDLKDLEKRGLLKAMRFQTENYRVVWTDMQFYLYTATSFVVTSMVVIIVVLMSSMLGYGLARLKFPGKMLILMLLLVGSVAPREAIIIPIFRFIMAAGLLSSLWGMILWLAGVSIGNAFLMAGFFLTLPREIEEAAEVDGAGPFQTFFAVVLPMARPIVMTVGLFAFLGAWNSFLIPLLTAQARPEFQPLALAVYMFKSGYESQWHWINAAATIMVIPVITLFLFLQRYIVNAIAVGAVKG